MALLEQAAAQEGVFHLWGHSWEVEQYQMWDELEAILKAASAIPNIQAKTNTDLLHG